IFAAVPAVLFAVGLGMLWSHPAKQLFHDTQISALPAPIRLANTTFPLILVAVMGAIASILVRFRRARGEERAQLKWVTYATVLLGAVYAGLAVGLGSVVGSNANSLVIAGATLVVAALFRPARRRIQAFIDRRFYRRKYDAALTLEQFAARLREEVDLEDLREHLMDVVGQTMQPTEASLWLRSVEPAR